MIDLTPLDVRKKRGDFRKALRGYDPEEVDAFLEVVAERMETLVTETLTLGERVERLREQVTAQEGREEAVREALVTAQELRKEMSQQARREAELVVREAESRIEGVISEAERRLEERRKALEEVERMRLRFLKSFRTLLERQLDAVEVEEGRAPLEENPLEIDFTVGELKAAREQASEELPGTLSEPAPEAAPVESAQPKPPTGAAAHPDEVSDGEVPVEDAVAGGAVAGEAVVEESVGQKSVVGEPPAEEAGSPEVGGVDPTPVADAPPAAKGAPEEVPGDEDQEGRAGSLWLSSILKEEPEGGEGEEEWP